MAKQSFKEIPVLDLSLAGNSETKPPFLESLRHAVLEVGFLYIKNFGIDEAFLEQVKNEGIAFFDLPEEKKLEIEMQNAPSFLGESYSCSPLSSEPTIESYTIGYNKLGMEITRFKTDWRHVHLPSH